MRLGRVRHFHAPTRGQRHIPGRRPRSSPASGGRPPPSAAVLGHRRAFSTRLARRARSCWTKAAAISAVISRILATDSLRIRRRNAPFSTSPGSGGQLGLARFDPVGLDSNQRLDGVDRQRDRRRAVEHDRARRRVRLRLGGSEQRRAGSRPAGRCRADWPIPSRPLGACGTRATGGRRMTSATSLRRQRIELAVDAEGQEASQRILASPSSVVGKRGDLLDGGREILGAARLLGRRRLRPGGRRHSTVPRRPRSGARRPPFLGGRPGSLRHPAGSRRSRCSSGGRLAVDLVEGIEHGAVVLDLDLDGIDDLLRGRAATKPICSRMPPHGVLDLVGAVGGLARQAADVVRHHGEAAARLRPARAASTAPLTASMVVCTDDQRDRVTIFSMLRPTRSRPRDRGQAGPRIRRGRVDDTAHQFLDRGAALFQACRHLAECARWPGWRCAARSCSALFDLRQRRRGLLRRGRLLLGAAIDLADGRHDLARSARQLLDGRRQLLRRGADLFGRLDASTRPARDCPRSILASSWAAVCPCSSDLACSLDRRLGFVGGAPTVPRPRWATSAAPFSASLAGTVRFQGRGQRLLAAFGDLLHVFAQPIERRHDRRRRPSIR